MTDSAEDQEIGRVRRTFLWLLVVPLLLSGTIFTYAVDRYPSSTQLLLIAALFVTLGVSGLGAVRRGVRRRGVDAAPRHAAPPSPSPAVPPLVRIRRGVSAVFRAVGRHSLDGF